MTECKRCMVAVDITDHNHAFPYLTGWVCGECADDLASLEEDYGPSSGPDGTPSERGYDSAEGLDPVDSEET